MNYIKKLKEKDLAFNKSLGIQAYTQLKDPLFLCLSLLTPKEPLQLS